MKFFTASSLALFAAAAQAYTIIEIFDQQNYKGSGTSIGLNDGTCTNFPSGWGNRVRSLKIAYANDNIDHGYCVFWTEANCRGDVHSYQIVEGSETDAPAIPAAFDRDYNSVVCGGN